MNTAIASISHQLEDAYNGDPWFGRSVKALLSDVNEQAAFIQPAGQHSILQLVYHMINWRSFTINSLKPTKPVSVYDDNDWQHFDHNDKALWPEGLQQLEATQQELVTLLQHKDDSILTSIVPGRKYDFRCLLNGLVQHDIYHAGQIAYVNKLLTARPDFPSEKAI